MTRILVQRGSTSSSNTRSSLPGSSSSSFSAQIPSAVKEEEQESNAQDPGASDDLLECSGSGDDKNLRNDELPLENIGPDECANKEKAGNDGVMDSVSVTNELSMLRLGERFCPEEKEGSYVGPSSQIVMGSSYPPPPPIPPPKPSMTNLNSRNVRSSSRRTAGWPVVSTRSSPSGSRPSSPRSYGDAEGYNSADEQSPCYGSSYDDGEKERQFELDIRRTKGLEVKRMVEDGNCLFRAVADQVYGDTEVYDLARQMCIDYMERERNHFSQFLTEGFTSYCKRKRRDKVYGNNMEIQALSEMYNRPIHIYSYSTEPINIFHGSYDTDSPPIRLSYHHGRHYNSLVDPRRSAIGAGLGFSSLHGINVDKDQVKAAIRAQQDQQIDNALLAEGRFYSDLELTEKEIERMVMEASRAEYLADEKFKPQVGLREPSTSGAEPSSSGATTGPSSKLVCRRDIAPPNTVLSNGTMQMVLSMGFSYLQVIEAYSIFGDDVDSMVCFLLEMGGASSARGGGLNRRKGKAAE
eukprot:TRINITY_DN5079_c0_g1_i2.p1 TRINITY_DN5079_c0_g1~~TRINITY_DN5079_c0_g1_i2.p1  ORF type:complete len:523 (-),score=112.25 TRINITY_DN5079_c0_g1_i2:206-1774(-)